MSIEDLILSPIAHGTIFHVAPTHTCIKTYTHVYACDLHVHVHVHVYACTCLGGWTMQPLIILSGAFPHYVAIVLFTRFHHSIDPGTTSHSGL